LAAAHPPGVPEPSAAGTSSGAAGTSSGAAVRLLAQLREGTSLLRWTTGIAALCPLLALAGVIVLLAVKAAPAIKYNGIGFLSRTAWDAGSQYANPVRTGGVLHPLGASFGALPLLVGTVGASVIAVVLAVPVSVGAALAIVEKLPRRLSRLTGTFLEVLAGIPSVVFGLWGYLVLGRVLARDVSPWIASHMPDVAVLNFLRGPTGNGEGMLTGGLVLAVMIVPIVAATTRDLLRQVPVLAKEGALALGMNDWEVARKVSLPWVRAGIIGASVLGLARALGETMAIAMVSGAALGGLPTNIYVPFTTIAATIVSQLDSAFTDGTGFYVGTLAELALVLAVITLLANLAARLMVRRVATTALPVGRGV
jgi:phosphate transport system permease protein